MRRSAEYMKYIFWQNASITDRCHRLPDRYELPTPHRHIFYRSGGFCECAKFVRCRVGMCACACVCICKFIVFSLKLFSLLFIVQRCDPARYLRVVPSYAIHANAMIRLLFSMFLSQFFVCLNFVLVWPECVKKIWKLKKIYNCSAIFCLIISIWKEKEGEEWEMETPNSK